MSGAVTVDYSCIDLPDWVEETPPSTITVSGLLGDGGPAHLAFGRLCARHVRGLTGGSRGKP